MLFRLLPELGKTLAVRPFRLGVSAALLGSRRGEPGVARRICLRFLGKTRSLVFGELLAVGIGKAHLRGFRQAAGDALCGKTLRQRALVLHFLRHSSALLPGGVFVPKFSSRTAFIFSSPYRI